MRTFDRDTMTCAAVASATLLAVIYVGHTLASALAYPVTGV